jgi:chaperonin GroEL (HSP60 family)
MPVKIEDAKILCLDTNLNKFKLGLNVEVVIMDSEKLAKIRE